MEFTEEQIKENSRPVLYDVDIHNINDVGLLLEEGVKNDLTIKVWMSVGVNTAGEYPMCLTCQIPKVREYDFIDCMRAVGLGRW